MQQDGQVSFIGFTGIGGNVLSQITDDSMLDGELKMLARKMSKRDTVTKIKVCNSTFFSILVFIYFIHKVVIFNEHFMLNIG